MYTVSLAYLERGLYLENKLLSYIVTEGKIISIMKKKRGVTRLLLG